MFLYILEYLSSINSNFQVFEYITLRAILSIITALMISLILGLSLNYVCLVSLKKLLKDIHRWGFITTHWGSNSGKIN